MARAIVTGGAGFLGSFLVDRLLKRGDEVLVLDNLVTGDWENLAHHQSDPRLETRDCDVSEPFEVEGAFDFVFHFASPASPVDFTRIPLEVMKANSWGTFHCLELARREGAQFFFASTSEVYGDPLVSPQPETYWGNVNPNGVRSVYDESKRFGEAMTMAYRRAHGVSVRIVRFFNTFGPRMRLDDGRVVPNFVVQALRGEPVTVYGDGSQTRSFGYCTDSIDGVIRLSNSDCQEPVNIGAEFEMTVLEFAEKILELTGSKSDIVRVAALADDPKQRRPDLSRAREVLGYEPRTPLDEALRRTIDDFETRLTSSGRNVEK